jgi:hypothetical protein
MNSTAITTINQIPGKPVLFVAPLLQRIRKESASEYKQMQEAFQLLGWGNLPDDLKIEILEDVRFMVQELLGLYSTCDPFVQRRRESVHFWVESFRDGICSKEAAIRALKVKSL